MAKQREAAGHGAYRGGGRAASGPSAEPGLVDEIVRQFADPYAFFRELVQNSIDAGASQIGVRVTYDAGERTARIAVQDDGSGMIEDVLTNDLTVLFKSTKENRDDTIGKFGIGFVSVLAVEPTLVAVETAVDSSATYRLELHPDHTWDLFRSEGRAKGTTVTLSVPTEPDAIGELVERSRAALLRWCEHARVPITFVAHGDGIPEAAGAERVDSPLSLPDALVEVSATSRDGHTQLVVGLPRTTAGGAFYNRGLLLHETTTSFPRLHGISFKAMDGRLEHTLSRDDVRRDASFASVLERLERAAQGPLVDCVHESSAGLGVDEFRVLFDAAQLADLSLRPDALEVPLAAPIEGRTTMPLARFALLRTCPANDVVARALASRGVPVLALAPATDAVRLAALAGLLGRGHTVTNETDALIEPVDDAELAPLLPHCHALLSAAHRTLKGIGLGRFAGAARDRLHVGAALGQTTLLELSQLEQRSPFSLFGRWPLVLRVDHPLFVAARGALGRGVRVEVVAALIARGVLAEAELSAHGARLTEAAIERTLETK